MIRIPKEEFKKRVNAIKDWMLSSKIDACFIYGDEYRRENLRYLCNFWPIFERGAVVLFPEGDPIILTAPEGEMLCREMSAWEDIRLVPDFTCVTVPEEIEYPFANYTTFKNVFSGINNKPGICKVGIAGIDAMPVQLYENVISSMGDVEVVNANDILFSLRLKKTANELLCLKKAAEIADAAYMLMMKKAIPGITETEMAGIATGEAMKRGAEYVPFCLVSSGDRVKTIIGRATNKTVGDGDMVMAALAVQYEGYIATFGFPFVVGEASTEQKVFISYLTEAFKEAMRNLKGGNEQKQLVKKVKECFRKKNLTEYDLYPPLHGCGLSEAESPYPNENTQGVFERNMTVNTDISIFGHPYGSNRIEAGFVVTETGYEPMSKLIIRLIDSWDKTRDYVSALD